MSTRLDARIVVATSGSGASRSAITYAAREAVSRDVPLEIVHVVTPTIVGGPYAATPDAATREAGRDLLTRGERLARQVAPHVEVTTTLLTGSRADAIVRHTHDAVLLVVGALPHDLAERLWTGSTVVGIAARSACPVVLVPEWEPRPAHHRILVGLKGTHGVDHLLATAFAHAATTQSELRIVHAWSMASPYDEAIAEHIPEPEFERDLTREIDGLLMDLRMAHPDVRVLVDVVHGRPGLILTEGSKDADLLVVSRPAHGGSVHHLGATARAVLRRSVCPVLVVPPRHEHDVVADLDRDQVQFSALL